MDTIGVLYRNLLVDPNLPAAIQRRILTRALRTNDYESLTRLATHPNLDPAVDADLGDVANVKVRAAWLARPNRDAAAVAAAIRRERRVAILVALAGRDDLPEAGYRALAETDRGAKIHAALVANSAAPLDARLAAATRWGKLYTTRSGWRLADGVAEVFDPYPELHDALASEARHIAVLLYVASADLSPASADHVRDRFVELAGEVELTGNWYDTSKIEPFVEIVSDLVENPTFPASHRQALAVALRRFLPSDSKDKVKVALASLRGKAVQAASSVALARSARTPEELASIVAALPQVWQAVSKYQRIGGAVLGNPAVTPEIVGLADRYIPYRGFTALVGAHAERRDVQVELFARRPSLWDDAYVATLPDPAAFLASVVDRLTALGQRPPEVIVRSRFCSSATLGRLPVDVLALLNLSDDVIGELAARLIDGIGDDDAHWDVFEGLAADASQTIDELMTAARLILGIDEPGTAHGPADHPASTDEPRTRGTARRRSHGDSQLAML